MTQPAILFDLDGTLVDTAPDLIETLNHILQQENLPPAPEALIRPMISEGARAMLTRGFELAQTPQTERQLDALTTRFIAHYSDNIARASRPFGGVIETLDHLMAAGHPLAVCTNKTEALAAKLLSTLAMDGYFAALIGADTLAVKKPHPGHVLGTIEAVGGAPGFAVMVGDSETDIRAAQAASIPVIAVDFGYSTAPVANFNPDAIISRYDELPAMVASLFKEPRNEGG